MSLPTFILAPDKFKCTLTAAEAALAMREGVAAGYPEASCIAVPMADGGEGTAKILAGPNASVMYIESLSHEGVNITVPVYYDNETAWVDTADVIGMKLTQAPNQAPFDYTTRPLGKLIARLLDRFEYITICVGGTATVDGGAGMLEALGARFCDRSKHPITDITIRQFHRRDAHHPRVADIDLSRVDLDLLRRKIRLVVDVDVPLVGPGLSSLDFAPQKGVKSGETDRLRDNLESYSALLIRELTRSGITPHRPPGGAGGGIEAIFDLIGCDRVLGSQLLADRLFALIPTIPNPYIITGEGSFDEQSLAGKITGTILTRARALNIPAALIAGRVTPPIPSIPIPSISTFPFTPSTPISTCNPRTPSTPIASINPSPSLTLISLTSPTDPVPDPQTSFRLLASATQTLAASLKTISV